MPVISMPDTLACSHTLANETATQALAMQLAEAVPAGVVFLQGDLGAGKTTLVRYWLQALGHTGKVKSPTYTLVEPYQLAGRAVFHFDLYRLQDPEELDMMGFEDYLQTDALVLIEWASKAGYLAPTPDVIIRIGTEDNEQRTVSISKG